MTPVGFRGIPSSARTLLVFPQSFEPNTTPPLGICFLAACLRTAGHQVDLLDLTVDSRSLHWSRYSVVGMSLLCANFESATRLARRIRQGRPDMCIIAGGAFADACPREILETGAFDFVLHGEGEKTLVQLLEALRSGEGPSGVAGLSFHRDGEIVRTPDQAPPADLDSLPFPAYDLLPPSRYRKHAVLASRGCPFQCIFCARAPTETPKMRYCSPARVGEWLDLLVRQYGCTAVRFVDSTFTVNQRWAEEICEVILERGLRLQWNCQSRMDCVNPSLLARMKQAGCTQFVAGVESGNAEILRLSRKGFRKDEVRAAAQLFKNPDAPQLCVNFIVGHPWDTIETIGETVAFANELQRDAGAKCGFFLMVPFPGSDLWDHADKYGLKIQKNWDQFCKITFAGNPHRLATSFDSRYLTAEELTRIYHQICGVNRGRQ